MATSRTVLITGCSSGIGAETAAYLAARGWTVWASARRVETLEPLVALGCKPLALDVTDEASMVAAVETVLADGPLDALVNNAGYSQSGAVETITMEQLQRQFDTNVFGLVRMCQLVLPHLRERGTGRIVNISSMGAHLTFPGGGAYHATKYAVNALSDALRFEVSGFGVKVITIEPGLIRTGFEDAAGASLEGTAGGPYAEFNARLVTALDGAYNGPMGKLGGGPETVAKAIDKALTAKRPKARYSVTPSAALGRMGRSLLGDRGWDLAMRSNFTPPQA